MRKVIVSEFMTLDGVIEDPGGAEKSPHGGWSFKFPSPASMKFKFDELFAADALLLGRVTYQGFAQAWPAMKDEAGFADRMNGLPKYVASSTLDKLEWNNAHLLKGDLAQAVTELKQQPGQDILVAGSAQLAQGLLAHDLVDEYRLMIYPIVVGGGKRLFGGSEMKTLRLAGSQTFESGVIVLTYAPTTL